MPMPDLDPVRFVPVMPVDPSHKVPMAVPGRFFSQDPANPDRADTFDPYVAQLLAGGSLRRACDVETANAKAAVAKAAAEKAEAEKGSAAKAAADAVKPPVVTTSEPETPPADPVVPPAPEAETPPAPASDPAEHAA